VPCGSVIKYAPQFISKFLLGGNDLVISLYSGSSFHPLA
jgi:hypothetical protein